MVKKIIEIYIAEDGREFQSEQERLNYERESTLTREIRDYCKSKDDCNKKCMFYDAEHDGCQLYPIPAGW